jgi:hypothetical protein
MARVQWNRAVRNLTGLAESCQQLAAASARASLKVRITELWAFGGILGNPTNLDQVQVALVVDLPADRVTWWSEPYELAWCAEEIRVAKLPFEYWWRSAYEPLWNHHIRRPAKVWALSEGVARPVLEAINQGDAEHYQLNEPTPEDLRKRLDAERALCREALDRTLDRFSGPTARGGVFEARADSLWRAAKGHLDVCNALDQLKQ